MKLSHLKRNGKKRKYGMMKKIIITIKKINNKIKIKRGKEREKISGITQQRWMARTTRTWTKRTRRNTKRRDCHHSPEVFTSFRHFMLKSSIEAWNEVLKMRMFQSWPDLLIIIEVERVQVHAKRTTEQHRILNGKKNNKFYLKSIHSIWWWW